MKIEYTEVSLEAVLDLYAKGFHPKGGGRIQNYEAFVDATKGKVIFRLAIEEKE